MASLIPYHRMNALTDLFNTLNDYTNLDYFTHNDPSSSALKMDVLETADAYLVEACVAGVSRDEIDVEMNEGRLVISVDKKDPEDLEQRTYLLRETGAYHAVRSIYLKDADTAGLSASLKDGILSVSVPKRTHNKNVTKIEIC